MTHRTGRARMAAVLLLSGLCVGAVSCSKMLDFTGLENADRKDVRTRNDVRVKEIVDHAQ